VKSREKGVAQAAPFFCAALLLVVWLCPQWAASAGRFYKIMVPVFEFYESSSLLLGFGYGVGSRESIWLFCQLYWFEAGFRRFYFAVVYVYLLGVKPAGAGISAFLSGTR